MKLFATTICPYLPDFGRSYDLVLDTATCEHCFNIDQAALNLASLVSKGGYLIQAMPLNLFNHGVYNVNPTWFYDFYPANGFRFPYLQAVANIVWNPQPIDSPAFDRFSETPIIRSLSPWRKGKPRRLRSMSRCNTGTQ